MVPDAQQIGDVAVRALLHRCGVALSVDVALLLIEAADSVAAGNAPQRQLAADLAAAQRGLTVMQADAALLQRRVAQSQADAAQWQARALRALQAGNEPLARQALARKLHVQRIAEQYEKAQGAHQQSLDQVQSVIQHLENRHVVGQVHAPDVRARPGLAGTSTALNQQTVDAQWEQFELAQAMNALRRKRQSTTRTS